MAIRKAIKLRVACLSIGAGMIALRLITPVRADVVTDWNQTTFDMAAATKTPQITQRDLAIVHTAIFDAVNGIGRRYAPFHVTDAAPAGASRRAAAAQAAYSTLVALIPDQKATLDTRLAASLAAINGSSDSGRTDDASSVALGVAWGQKVATDILAWRQNDGYSKPPPAYPGGTGPGQWRPTPPMFLPAAAQNWALAAPFALTSTSQLRPGPPPALTSDLYTTDYNEIKAVGRKDSTTRTALQTEIANFWPTSLQVILWNSVLRSQTTQHQITLDKSARLFALASLSLADTLATIEEAKFFYGFWRPVTAIQTTDPTLNPKTTPDATWTSLGVAPPFPDYPSNAGSLGGAYAEALALFFGDKNLFSLQSSAVPGATHTFSSFSDMANEGADSRVFQGIHFRNSTRVGLALGRTVTDYIDANFMKPLNDVNGDGRVTIGDAVLALEIAMGLLMPTDAQKKAADADGDGTVDLKDVTIILRYAIGL